MCCGSGRSKSHQGRRTIRAMPCSRRISLFFVEKAIAGAQLNRRPSDIRHPRRRVRPVQSSKKSRLKCLTASSGCFGASNSISTHMKWRGTTSNAKSFPSWYKNAASRTVSSSWPLVLAQTSRGRKVATACCPQLIRCQLKNWIRLWTYSSGVSRKSW